MSEDKTRSDTRQRNTPGAEELFRLMSESVHDYAIFATDSAGRVVSWNAGAERIFGYTEAEMKGQDASVIFTPEDIACGAHARELETAATQGRAEDERWHVRRDGSRFWASGIMTPLRGADGELRGFVKIARDETRRRLGEERLRLSEALSGALIEQSPFSIQILSPDGRTLRVNRAWQELWGVTLEQIADYNMLEDEQLSARGVMPYIRRGFAGEAAEIPPIMYDPNETLPDRSSHRDPRRWVRAFIYPVKDAAGRVLEVVLMHEDISERKRAEDALRESEERFQRLVELSPDAIVVHAEGRVAFINTSGVRLLRAADPAQIVGKPIFEFLHPDYHEAARERLKRLGNGAGVSLAEMKFIRLDGTELFGEVVSVPFLQQDKPAVQVVVRDITERRRLEEERRQLLAHEQAARAEAEEALRLQRSIEERLTLLVEASQVLLGSPALEAVQPAILDLSRRLISADAYAIWRVDRTAKAWRVVAQAGMSESYREQDIRDAEDADALLDRPLVVEDVTQAAFLSERRAIYRAEGIKSLLVLPLRIHGLVSGTLTFYYRQTHPFSETEVRVATALANLAGSAISSSELYEEQSRMRAEAESAERRAHFLAEASRLLASTLDYQQTLARVAQLAVPDLADWCAVDMAGEDGSLVRLAVAHADPAKVIWANELQERYPVDIAAPQGVPNVLRTGRSELYADIPDELLVASAVDDEHLRIMREIGFTSAMVVPLSAHGRTLGAITFVLAESGRRYGPSDLAFAEVLARRAATAIANAGLYAEAQEARRVAEDASRLKDEFLATVSHELRTPLTAVLGWAHMLRAEQLDERSAKNALETIERNARAQAQLIDDLLDVSRIITGKLRLDVRPVDPASFIEVAIDAVRPAAEAKGVRIQRVLDTGVRSIAGDPNRLQQVVWNLLSNAIKFTPRGGRVQVRLERVDSHVEIAVSDTGIGITQKFLPFVFDRFRQADGTTTRAHGGLGLGLSIVRHLVELHGGTVQVESQGEGLGATFTVKLPLLTVFQSEGGHKRVHPAARDTRTSFDCPERLDGLRVLVVDDETDTRELLRAVLEQCGGKVSTAASAEEALRLLESLQTDMLISDIGMPGEDGYELIKKIRARPPERGGEVPAIALTAYARTEDRLRALRSGYQMHVTKPVELSELVAVVASLVRRNG
ncbi:MAG TPA: PAS domain S-box protein [Pyrinomonadaceae bacterium]|jgi:PAS domain S-box-containing protein|nr:PAS domain S-box protein [Pyrinomonadaceae bacterium]